MNNMIKDTKLAPTRAPTGEANKPQPDIVRVQFDFARDVVTRIDALKVPLNANSRADVMKCLIPCGELIINAKQRGAAIFVREADGTMKQVEFLW